MLERPRLCVSRSNRLGCSGLKAPSVADPPPEVGERLLRARRGRLRSGRRRARQRSSAPALVAMTPSKSMRSLLEQAVEHAPGEGAVGAAALQGEVDASSTSGPRLSGGACECGMSAELFHRCLPLLSVRGPAAIDRHRGAGDRGRAVAARKTASAPISSTVAKRLFGWFFSSTSRMTRRAAMPCDFAWSSICFSTSGVQT